MPLKKDPPKYRVNECMFTELRNTKAWISDSSGTMTDEEGAYANM